MGKRHSISKVMLMFAWLMLCVNSVFAAWDGKEMVKPARDTKNDKVCIIDTEAKLAWYAKTGNTNNYADCDAKLTADLDLGGELWIPIAAGTGNTLYSKTFDGNGHIIKNLYINGDELHKIDKSYTQNIGFVAALGENGTIKNLVLENVNIQASTSTGDVLSNTATENHQISVGAFVGWMADKKKEVVEKCMVSGIISTTGKGQGVGGIVGNAKQGTISNCLSLVEIRTSGSDAYVGGIIGLIKTDVTVASCVYAGPGLLNLGISNGGSVGGIAGNVYSGNLTVQDDFYEGEDNLQLYGAKCFGNFNDKGECNSSPSVKDASSVDVDGNVGRVRISNQDSVACHLNGTNDDKTCKTEPWAVGETNLSLFGYGTDGYMIVFYANGGKYADGSVAKNKFFDAGMAINADDIVPPSDEERTFVGWALTRDATAPVENLGTVSKSDTVFAVWQPKLTVTFNVSPGVFPDENVDVKTKKVDKGGLVTVGGLGTLPTSYCGQDSAGSCTQWMYFTGWAHKEKPGINDTIHLDTLKANKDYLTLYAVWTAIKTYTVIYNANGHGKTRVDYVHVGENEKLTQPQDPIAHDGYVFETWFTTSSCEKGSEFHFDTEITKSITLYAKWTPESYNITYKSVDDDGLVKDFGGEGGPVNSPKNPIKYNIESETINLMAPTPVVGKAFDGWYKDAAFSKKVTRIAKGSFGDRTFYAKWSTKTYRIAYLADNDSYGAVSDQFKVHGESINLETDGHFRRPGYDKQLGWTNTQNGSVDYEFGAVYTVDAPLILYPAWSEPIVYEIKYVCADCENDPSNPVSYTVNTAKELKSPSKIPEGYKFGGWFTDKKCTKKISKIEKGTTGNLTLYGKLNQIYNITYVGTDTPNNPKTYTVDDNTIQLKAPASREHYTFIGWFDKDSEDGQQVTEIAKGSSGDKTLYARWAAVEYKITYTTNDGTLPDGVENPQIYTIESEDITLPIPTKDGYDFVGWYGNDEFNGDAITGIAKGSTGDTTLFAKWNGPIEYTITYNNIEGATNENPTTYTVESDTIQLVAAVKAGYDFAGWFDKDGEEVTAIAKGSTGNIELTAKWNGPIEYTIAYNNVEDATNENPVAYTVESETIQLANAVKSGYTFVGWFDKDDEEVTQIAKGSTGDTTLYAKWTAEVYSITYNANEGTLPDDAANPQTYTVEHAVTLPIPTKNGYDFVGWYDKENNKIEKIANGSTGDIELTAKWSEPIKYTITVNVNGGTLPEGAAIPETYTVESENVDLPIPTKNGYTFAGWYDQYDNYIGYTIYNQSSGDITLYAKWSEPIEYKITVNVNDGKLPDGAAIPGTYTVESDITLPIPTKNGYTFEGWYGNGEFNGDAITGIAKGTTGDTTLFAKWSDPVKYEITYELNGGELPEGVSNPAEYTVVTGDITLPTPTRIGYDFVGWYDKEGEEGKLVEKIAEGSTGDIELTAKWEIIIYTISYVAGGEGVDGENTSDKKEYGTPVRLKGESIFTREGYVQDGWALSEDGEKVYALGAYYRADEDVALYPHWVQGLVVEHYGAVTIYRYPDEKVTAVCDGEYTGTDVVNITNNIKVDEITFIRNFNVGVSSTVVLPFSINLDNIKGGSFYRFNSILKKNDSKSVGFSTIGDSKLYANTPYLFIPNESELVFKGGAVFNTSVKPVKEYIENDSWKFNGTYEYMNFDNHLEHGYIWGFVGQQHVGFKVGAFVKAGTNVTIKPFRAYLIQPRDPQLAKSSGSLLDYLGSLDEIDVVIVDDDDNVIESGKMNIVTGKIRMDRWYDLKGRVLNSKPTARGTYYHKGKRVIIK